MVTLANTLSDAPAVVIGGGPAGLIAAEAMLDRGLSVALYDTMPSVGRKFLRAGIGGLNITHAEDYAAFCSRYRAGEPFLRPHLQRFTPQALREWVHTLGIESFVGSSGRVFPKEMKAAPLLRAWLTRLRRKGLRLHTRHRWLGWSQQGALLIQHQDVVQEVPSSATVLALGGGSWAKLGSDGAWVPLLREKGIAITELEPANCGFCCHWSPFLQEKFSGAPVKLITLSVTDQQGQVHQRRGEFVLSHYGLEGSLIYALSAEVREQIKHQGQAVIHLDLLPDITLEKIVSALHNRGKKSLSHALSGSLKLSGVKKALLFEHLKDHPIQDAEPIARLIKALPLRLYASKGIEQAISSAGGVTFAEVTAGLMLKKIPGVFCAGEMLDWEAPTGGYLLNACFSTGLTAGESAAQFVASCRA